MFVPRQISAWLHRVLPPTLTRPLHRLYAPFHGWLVARQSRRLIRQLFPSGELSVQDGPFRGMKYVPMSRGSALVPKLLGVYELELHDFFTERMRHRYRQVIDIGCAEGYYLVGLARQHPEATLHGFDLDSQALATCRRLAEVNEVTPRIHLAGRCSGDALAGLVGEETLIVCDCEGAEVELLNPTVIPGLRQADLVVELHDWIVPHVSETIPERFAATHRVRLVSSQERDPRAYPSLAKLSEADQRMALEEFRPGPMQWAVLEARRRPA